MLKKGGYVIIAIPFLYPVHESPYDYYRYTRHGIEYQLKKNKLVVERSMPWGASDCYYVFISICFFEKWSKVYG